MTFIIIIIIIIIRIHPADKLAFSAERNSVHLW